MKNKQDLKKYLAKIYKKTQDDRLIDNERIEGIFSLIHKSAKITNLTVSDLTDILSFKENNLSIEALEAFLAELRTVVFLQELGFSQIVPIKTQKKSKKPDFEATYNDKKSIIEVFCLTATHGQQKNESLNCFVNFNPQFSGSKMGRDFFTKAKEKKAQLDTSNADIKMLVCVINSRSVVYLNNQQDLELINQYVFNKLSWNSNYHIGLLLGGDSSIYPVLSNN